MTDVGRVVVGISGSPRNTAALHTAARLAARFDRPLIAVCAWQPNGGETTPRRYPCPALDAAVRDRARDVLQTALDSLPPTLDVRPVLYRGPAGYALVHTAEYPDDLLVVGAGRRTPVLRTLCATVSRYCGAHARCPVLVVPEPELLRHLRRPFRRLSVQPFTDDHPQTLR